MRLAMSCVYSLAFGSSILSKSTFRRIGYYQENTIRKYIHLNPCQEEEKGEWKRGRILKGT